MLCDVAYCVAPVLEEIGSSRRARTRIPFELLGVLLFTVLGFLVMGYHPGLEDDGVYLAAVKADLNPGSIPLQLKFLPAANASDCLRRMDGALCPLDADAAGVGGAAVAMGRAVSDSLGSEEDCESAVSRRTRAMGRSRNGGGHVYAARNWNRALHGRPVSASARTGDGDDPAGDLANSGWKTMAGGGAAAGRPSAASTDGSDGNFVLRDPLVGLAGASARARARVANFNGRGRAAGVDLRSRRTQAGARLWKRGRTFTCTSGPGTSGWERWLLCCFSGCCGAWRAGAES